MKVMIEVPDVSLVNSYKTMVNDFFLVIHVCDKVH